MTFFKYFKVIPQQFQKNLPWPSIGCRRPIRDWSACWRGPRTLRGSFDGIWTPFLKFGMLFLERDEERLRKFDLEGCVCSFTHWRRKTDWSYSSRLPSFYTWPVYRFRHHGSSIWWNSKYTGTIPFCFIIVLSSPKRFVSIVFVIMRHVLREAHLFEITSRVVRAAMR